MYIWIGAVLPKEFEDFIRNKCKMINKKYNVNEQSFTLPQHVSLKTSFDYNEYDKIIEYIKNNIFYNIKNGFNVTIEGIEQFNGVLWLKVKENENLRKLHDLLNEELERRFNIPKIKFDGIDFKFHSTLFQDFDNNEKLHLIFIELQSILKFPIVLNVDEINFGISETGIVGTFKVFDKIYLNNECNQNI